MTFGFSASKTVKVSYEESYKRFDETGVTFYDTDGLKLGLVARLDATGDGGRATESIPQRHAIRRFFGVTITEEGYEKTPNLLTSTLGFRLTMEERKRFKNEVGGGGPGAIVGRSLRTGFTKGEGTRRNSASCRLEDACR